MWVSVTPIYCNGKRRDPVELRKSRPTAGQLRIGPAVDPELPGRPNRIARLVHPDHRGKESNCVPLYDPEILSMSETGFFLRGFNIVETGDGRPQLYVQGWLVRQIAELDRLGVGGR